MKVLVIVNEKAGKGKTKKRWPKIQQYLEICGINHEVHFTLRPKEAIEVVKQAEAKQFTHVIAVGGDGTVNEVVNGMVGRNMSLGVIPTGTGNDFARMLNIPADPFLSLKKISSTIIKPIDILELNGSYIAGAIGIGFDGAVAEDMNRASWKKRAGSLGYVLSMLKLSFSFPPFTLNLEIDKQPLILHNCWLIAVGNSKFYGGGMKICPDAKYDDGLLDVCIVHNLTRIQLLRLFPSVFSGKHVRHPNVLSLQGRSVHILTDPVVPVHGDGEILGHTPGKIHIRPQALNIIC